MKIFIGTSGFSYSWNPDGLEWYLQNSGLDVLELNSSFYRFPFPNYINSWVRKTKEFNLKMRWIIKVNRLITHVFKFSKKALDSWKRFKKLFRPLDNNIYFYLFQLPPSFTPKNYERVEKFIKKIKLRERFALEIRNIEWFDPDWLKWAKKLKITWVSVDSPKFPLEVYNLNGIVYERMHGRKAWYSHNYSNEELKGVAEKILKTKPKEVYILFNNNHSMLSNARKMKEILRNFS